MCLFQYSAGENVKDTESDGGQVFLINPHKSCCSLNGKCSKYIEQNYMYLLTNKHLLFDNDKKLLAFIIQFLKKIVQGIKDEVKLQYNFQIRPFNLQVMTFNK